MKAIGVSCVLVLLLVAAQAEASYLVGQNTMTAWATSEWGGYPPSNTLDSSVESIWAGNGGDADPYLRYDLGESKTLDKFAMAVGRSDPANRPKDFRLWVTDTLTTGDITGWASPLLDSTFADTSAAQEFTFTAATGQYVYLLFDGQPYNFAAGSYATVGDVKVYAEGDPPPPPPGGGKIDTTGWTATASSVVFNSGSYDGSKAIDGNEGSDWVSGKGEAGEDGSLPENLKIDMGQAWNVCKIRYRSRTCGVDVTKDYKFWVTDTSVDADGSDLTAVLGEATAEGAFASGGSVWADIFLDTPVEGQYVYFQGDSSYGGYSGDVSASEIEVYWIPEPASAFLLLSGGVLAVCRRRKK